MKPRATPGVNRRLQAEKQRRWRKSHVKKQNGLCYYCGKPMREDLRHLAPTLDHYVPLCMGGEDHFENVVAACNRCNQAKKNMHGDEFLKLQALKSEAA